MAETTLSGIVHGHLCSGCGLCSTLIADNKVSMVMSPEGFLRPQISKRLTVEENAIVARTCPGNYLEHEPGNVPYDSLWGPVVSVRTGFSLDEEVRYQGSSGGAISALLIHLLESGAVDYVAHVAASETDPLKNEVCLSRTRAEVLKGAGSRYAPSAPLENITALLDQPGRFAFVGKPCDVAGLRNLGRVDKRVSEKVAFCIAFFCAGVPSQRGTLEVLNKLGVAREELAKFSYRGEGWPGKAKAVTHDGRVSEMDYATSWGTILNRHLQFRCKICPDGTGEFADIACADAWYGKDGYPEFDEQAGRSLILARTKRGEDLIADAMQAKVIGGEPCDLDQVALMQPYQKERKSALLARLAGVFLKVGTLPRFRNIGLAACSRRNSLVTNLRNFAGSYRRAQDRVIDSRFRD
ncbi:MAG: Coenzyme F420 hydrogenase/dehydrogenase, beta subunit C-terminal domain [Azonexus sp.]